MAKIDYKDHLEQEVERKEDNGIEVERQRKQQEQAKIRFNERRRGYYTYEPEINFKSVMRTIAYIVLLIKAVFMITNCLNKCIQLISFRFCFCFH